MTRNISHTLQPLLSPRSIAVLGASNRPGSIGAIVLQSLARMRFDGDVWPINPKYRDLFGYTCLDALADLPKPPDVTAICLSGSSAASQLRTLANIGGRAAVIYDGGFAETGSDGAEAQKNLIEFCRESGIVLCGPNCMGTLNPHDKATTYKLPIYESEGLKGNVGLISQSGSITIGLLGDVRRFGFSHVISTGNEAVLSAADYIDFLVNDENTRVIAIFLESVRSPDRFQVALQRAAAADKPVVILKVGRSRRAMQAVHSHTGGLAGEARVFSEFLKRAGVIEVHALDEMTEILSALQLNRLPTGRRIAVITGSGGHAELILDAAESEGLDMPPLQPPLREKAEAAIGHFSGDGNPLDAWGSGDIKSNLGFALNQFATSQDYDVVVLCNENIEGALIGRSEVACATFCDAARQSDKPHYLLNTRPGLMHNENLAMLKEAGAGMLGGVRQGLGAIDSIARWANRKSPAANPASSLPESSPLAGETRRAINEYDSKRLLDAFGVPVVPERVAGDFDAACAAAEDIGWPVVLKAISDKIAHKSEAGLVLLDIEDVHALRDAWDELVRRCRATRGADDFRMLVQKMVKGGVEVFVGVKRDPQWGSVIAFGVGGTLVELIDEMALCLLPVSVDDVNDMIAQTRASKLLAGFRGSPPADVTALRNCIMAVSQFANACGDTLAEMDLNPIKVLPNGRGCFVVDALIATTTGVKEIS